MTIIQLNLEVPNDLARESNLAGVFNEIDNDFLELVKNNNISPKPLLICGGGTSSRCAANGHWTLDLREKYQSIHFDRETEEVEVGAGIRMSRLLDFLAPYGRSFPTGLSGETGIGYILTGGISPLSRSQGLAIDQVKNFKGIWGSGEKFDISKPSFDSTNELIIKWRGLCGAAPFLAIVTSLRIKTFKRKDLIICETFLEPDQLSEIIVSAESWPISTSLQWIWADKIKCFAIMQLDDLSVNINYKHLLDELQLPASTKISRIEGLNQIPKFSLPISNKNNQSVNHSEVIGILSKSWKNRNIDLIKSINKLINHRPNKNCYIASQQLGGNSSLIDIKETSFIHRESIWKPWINASWPAGDLRARNKSLLWLKEAWKSMESICPGVHLAQIHSHLNSNKKEINAAFQDWLPELQKLKSKVDPNGLLPPL